MDALRIIMRRWLVVLLGLMLTGLGAAGALKTAPVSYEASGNMLFLLPPDSTGSINPTNPYINMSGSVVATASLISGTVTTPEVAAAMAADGFTAAYSIGLSPITGIPLLEVSSSDKDPVVAENTLKEVMRRIDATLASSQADAGAPKNQLIYTKAFSLTPEASPIRGDKIRAAAVALALGIILTIVAVAGAERLAGIRRRRLAGNDASVAEESALVPDASAATATATQPVAQPVAEPVAARRPVPAVAVPAASARPKTAAPTRAATPKVTAATLSSGWDDGFTSNRPVVGSSAR